MEKKKKLKQWDENDPDCYININGKRSWKNNLTEDKKKTHKMHYTGMLIEKSGNLKVKLLENLWQN
jgi:hypothetical protein